MKKQQAGPFWLVRAGRGGDCIEEFRTGSWVGLGWTQVGPLAPSLSDEKVEALFAKYYPTEKEGSRRVWAAQVKRFLREIQEGDPVSTYDPNERLYLMGTIRSEAKWKDHPLGRYRDVEWTHKVPRDVLSVGARNGLGSIATLFRVSADVSAEMREKAVAIEVPTLTVQPVDKATEAGTDPEQFLLRDEVVERASQFIEDRIAALDWEDMQRLVAGILRAMGFQTRISEKGPDRGVDVFASPDGLGLREPRVFVEVKHRSGAMGSQQIRAFLGGRNPGDRCLYVSTGGFTKDARYEAERSQIPIMLLTLEDLRVQLLTHYENLDPPTQALVPLQRVYWPVR